ncbi:TetR/AcrR family transcriptional regulator [Bizionia gelidisalsuginis]|uniref:TetR/AcrR family transcriptional regulator n=2 Tax=Bizionia TaxID=283785 RepID=A0A8H2LEF9_9FLAO|nr:MULTISPECIES: TetR/AcrR family transcriptional regulator [Bizionia]TYB74498.1 TetR/AcrR family transcriptional regulator [Bizionia saleffrena]TYC16294.1 TetR/AcrR family transcriptional regulator [Bizionia gelidisalsuginis]
MARKKEYNEDEVVEKAMNLFWRNGYETTSMQMLEKEMGINKFSIYASFGNKQGLFLESLKYYKIKASASLEKFKNAENGVEAIKQFFNDSVNPEYKENNQKGCFVTNTYNAFSESEDLIIKEQMAAFMTNLKALFIAKLAMDSKKDKDTVLKQANYLLLAKHGLAAAARVNTQKEIKDYIEMVFKNV